MSVTPIFPSLSLSLFLLSTPETAEELDTNKFTRIRDGTSTQRQDFTQPSENTAEDNYQNSREGNVKVERGLHESYDYYADCTIRQRNQCKSE